jgi:sporulation protein YlmC with PRC-barrel domain
MKNFLSVLAVLALMALGPALAQGNVLFHESGMEGDLLATELIGADLYTTATAIEHDRFRVDVIPDDWEQIATISDVVLGVDGQVRGVLVDVGGFLGLGARTVMLGMESVRIATLTGSNAVHGVIHATREDLEAAPEYMAFDRTGQAPVGAPQPAAPVATQPAAPVAPQPAAPARPRVGIAQPAEGFATVDWSTLSVDQLRQAEVYDVNNERVSGISDIIFNAEGNVEAVLIDVGGFLGFGQRSVAISMDQLEIQGKEDLSDLRVYLGITEQQLEALPEHVSN